MDISTLLVGGENISSLIVLESRVPEGRTPATLPIRIGSVEAAAISMGLADTPHERPMTHDLLNDVIDSLGARLLSVAIVDVRGTTFYAQLNLVMPDNRRVNIDCRPSDAFALAVRSGVPILAEESVLYAAMLPDFMAVERDEKDREMERFHDFVESLSPDDFTKSV